jgi:hypothetical protein
MQRGVKGSAAGWFITLLALLLMLYTAFHTYQFISIALPNGNKIWGYLALGAFDAGALGWLLAFMYHSRGTVQRVIASVMAVASFLGIAAGLILDTFLQAGRNGYTGKVDQGTVDTILWFAVAIILLHVFAGGIYLVFDPQHLDNIASENLRSRIEVEARRQTEQQVEILAAQLAPRIAADQMRRMQTKYLAGLGNLPPTLLPAPTPARLAQPKLKSTSKATPKMRVVKKAAPKQVVVGREQPQFPANQVDQVEEFEEIEEVTDDNFCQKTSRCRSRNTDGW